MIVSDKNNSVRMMPLSRPRKKSPYDLEHFGLREMIECGRDVRELGNVASSMESAAELLVSYFRNTFIDAQTSEKSCALVRCFKTHRFKDLPLELRDRASKTISNETLNLGELPCLTLLATGGDLSEWQDRSSSASHAVIPLESVAIVERVPMISQLIVQMGLEIGAVLSPTKELILEGDERAYGVFHVENAVGSPSIPSQNFVVKHGIRSVLGFGGLLPSGDLFVMILFTRAHVSQETANLFRTIALSVKLVLLPFTRGPVFSNESAPYTQGSTLRTFEHEQIRSESATLRLLIPALEDAAVYQTNRLEDVVADLRLQAEEVRRLGTRLSSVLESTTDAVYMLDRNWTFTYLNSHAIGLLGANGDLLGRNLWDEFPSLKTSTFWERLHTSRDSGLPVMFEEHYPHPIDRSFEVHAFPNEEGVAVFFHDVTERKKSEAVLIKNEKLAAVGRLSASIAHEINNPLESVTNLLFLAQRSTEIDEVHEYLATADRELRRVGAITSQTLRFHKQSSSQTLVFCQELIDDVLSIYQGRLVNSHVYVEKRKRECEPILCYEGEIRQVLNNLVGNAIDAMHPSGGKLYLRSRKGRDWKTHRHGLVITVADSGPGMSVFTQSRCFEPFFTTKGIGGSGLGLWISRGIVDRHMGTLSFRSSQKEGYAGTAFTLFLPFGDASIGATIGN
jgi:PAS domain S-box-containing protein